MAPRNTIIGKTSLSQMIIANKWHVLRARPTPFPLARRRCSFPTLTITSPAVIF